MSSWRCRLGFHNWLFVASDVKVVVGKKNCDRADYKICTECELVKDV